LYGQNEIDHIYLVSEYLVLLYYLTNPWVNPFSVMCILASVVFFLSFANRDDGTDIDFYLLYGLVLIFVGVITGTLIYI
jgi:hypothetical protein